MRKCTECGAPRKWHSKSMMEGHDQMAAAVKRYRKVTERLSRREIATSRVKNKNRGDRG